jgi:hypothetical protein
MKHRLAVVLVLAAVAAITCATAVPAAPKPSPFTVTVLDAQTGAKVYPALVVVWDATRNAQGEWVKVDPLYYVYATYTAKTGKAALPDLAPNKDYILEVGRSTDFPAYSGVILTNGTGGGSVTVRI